MHKALKEGLEDRVPPTFFAHYNDDTVPLTITLGITFLELIDICSGISALIHNKIPMLTGPIPSMQMFFSPGSPLFKTSSHHHVFYKQLAFNAP
eukprot:855517-Prorocentrum_lima.AAC.1